MKRGICVLLLLLLASALAVSTVAEADLLWVEDGAELMTSAEALALEEALQQLYTEYALNIAIVTTDSLGLKSPRAYADDCYDQRYGAGSDGILFLLSMEDRDWYISTSGLGMDLLSDYETYDSVDDILSYLSSGSYYEGFALWAQNLPYYLDSQQAEYPDYEYDEDLYYPDYEYAGEAGSGPNIWISLVIGAGVALVAIVIMRSGMNTKRKQPSARHYLVGGSYHLRSQQDIFLYSNVTKTAKPKEHSGGSGGHHHGGGHSHSGGGRSHGGGGGKF